MKKYIILGNGLDWCELSLHGIEKRKDIFFSNTKLPLNTNPFFLKLSRYYFSNTVNRMVELPFKKLWYSCFYKNMCLSKENKQVLIIYDKHMLGCNRKFLKDVKRSFPNIKLVYVFTNIVKYSGAIINNFIDQLNKYYDVVLAFDPLDAEKYDFEYSPLVYNIDDKYTNHNMDNQVFYVGTAKDRLSELIEVYKKLQSMGIKCDYNIAEVEETRVESTSGIKYNKRIPYSEVLCHIAKSECLIDIIQGDSSGLTIKTCEAVCYDKKLITTNQHVSEYSFYDPRYIRIIKNVDDITQDFFDNDINVCFRKEDKEYFSTEAFLERINEMLRKVSNNEKY